MTAPQQLTVATSPLALPARSPARRQRPPSAWSLLHALAPRRAVYSDRFAAKLPFEKVAFHPLQARFVTVEARRRVYHVPRRALSPGSQPVDACHRVLEARLRFQ